MIQWSEDSGDLHPPLTKRRPQFIPVSLLSCGWQIRNTELGMAVESVQRTRRELMTALEAAGVPTGSIHDVAEVFADPQVVAREMRIDLKEREEGGATIPGVRTPIRFSATPARYDHPSPRLPVAL